MRIGIELGAAIYV